MCELCQYRFQFAPNRIFKFLMYGSMWSVVRLPFEIFALENLLFDCLHGLVVVLLSLLGFISVVWLRDQLGHGLGPNWLEEDRQEVNRVVMREAQERVDLLRRHLEEAGARALQRHVPDRVAVAAELSELHDMLTIQSNKLASLMDKKYIDKLRELWKREMEIMYDMHGSILSCKDILLQARKKKSKHLLHWHIKTMGMNSSPPTDAELGLSYEECVVLKLHDKPSRNLSEADLSSLRVELQTIRACQSKLIAEELSYNSSLCRHMSSMNSKLSSKEDSQSESIIPILSTPRSDEEQQILVEIWNLKSKVKVSTHRESLIIGRQHDEELMRREVVEARMNRWYNRLLNRHQNDPLVLARRQRRNNRRPNIGHAIAGLARDRNPLDVDEMGDNMDELTWARLLGLDGSYRFLEHVVWLICLNSALLFGFVYLPYQLGYLAASLLSFWNFSGIVNWTGITSIFIGYCILSVIVLGFYYATGRLHKPRIKSAMGITFISIKVGMILAVEAGIFPLMCGWWIDICSFTFFNSTLAMRQESMSRAPGTVMFLHWLAGMIFIFYLASFVMLLREVFRPGVLWFLRNLNDQNFHPINEMINLPIQRHIRRFLMSCVLFGVCVMVVLLLPSKIILLLFNSFLPYKFSLTNTVSPIREIQIELILLQFIIPTLLEHGNCRAGFKILVRNWANLAARLFGLRSYLLDQSQTGGCVVDVHGSILYEVPFNANHSGPAFTGRLQVIGPGFAPFKPYLRPSYFYFRIGVFLIYTVFTTILFSTLVLTLPVAVGRFALNIVGLVDAPEMYTASIGLYLIWIAVKLIMAILPHASQGASVFFKQMILWTGLMVKCLFAGIILFVIIPLMMGHLVELILLSPLRVPINKFPVFYPSTEWALGLLHTKCVCGIIWLMDFNFKHTLDAVYQAGIRNINLVFILVKVAWPVISILSLSMTLPYIFFLGILYSSGFMSYRNAVIGYRYFFPCSLLLFLLMGLVVYGYIQCRKLYDHVRNEKYLIGRQLVNFEEFQE